MNEAARSAVLIVGMHRSGTSAVAGSLARLGVALGQQLLAAGEDNRKGYFEHEEAVRLDDALLDALDRRWDDPRPLPDDWLATEAAQAAGDAIARLLADEFAGMPLLGFKDPRFCRLLPLWKAALRRAGIEPCVLLVVRHPFEVAASLRRRNGFAPALSQALWLGHMLAAERDSRDCRRAVVAYDDLLGQPEAVLQRAVAELGLSDRLVTAPLTRLTGFVSAEERHFAGGAARPPGSNLDALAEEAMALFRPARLETAGFDRLQQHDWVQQLSAEGLAGALAGRVLAAQRELQQLQVALAEQRTQLNAQLAWSQAAVVEREGLQAELAEAKSALRAQIGWSEDAVRVRDGLYEEIARLKLDLEQLGAEKQGLQALLARYESSLLGRIQRRWMRWQDQRGQMKEGNR